MHPARLRLGQLLIDARILTPEQLEDVLTLQKTDGRKLGVLLVESGLVTETLLTQVLSQQLSVPWVSLNHIDFSRELLELVPLEVAEKYCLVPIYVRVVRGQGDTLYVAMEDPMNEDALRDCTAASGLPARAMIAAPSDIFRVLRLHYGSTHRRGDARRARWSVRCRVARRCWRDGGRRRVSAGARRGGAACRDERSNARRYRKLPQGAGAPGHGDAERRPNPGRRRARRTTAPCSR